MNIYRNIENQLRTTYLKNTLGPKKAVLNVNAMVCTYMVLMLACYSTYAYIGVFRIGDHLSVKIPAAIYDESVDGSWNPLTVYINDKGLIGIGYDYYHIRKGNINRLPDDIKEKIDAIRLDKTKIKLKIDRLAPFGKVQAFLRAARKAGICEFCFITVPRAGLIDFMGRERLNLKKK